MEGRPRVATGDGASTGLASRVLLWVVMAGIAVVVVRRAAEQVRRPGALTARGEVRWQGWAYRDPGLLGRLGAAETRLEPGDVYCVENVSGGADPVWLQAMTNYAFWRALPAGRCSPGGVPASRVSRVVVSRAGEVFVLRGAAR